MELTITQNGALYAAQHESGNYLRKQARPDLIWSYQALTRPIEKVQATPQNTAEQYGFLEFAAAA